LADDGGLYVFDEMPSIKITDLENKSYQDITLMVLQLFFTSFSKDELKRVIDEGYQTFNINEVTNVKSFENYGYLEQFHGPTLAFKDLALSLFPGLLGLAMKHENYQDKILIVTATSGDTGSAAMNAIAGKENIDIIVLYPNGGTSSLQKEQMQKIAADNVEAIGIYENFDKAQDLVKQLFDDKEFIDKLKSKNYQMSSANSINIARLIPQVAYYIDAYLKLVRQDEIKMNDKIDIIVPTGNFGNILAGFIAKSMGVPIDKITCVSNANDVIYKFFKTGVYDARRELLKTNTPSMDILISSNLERFLYFIINDEEKIAELMNNLKVYGFFKVDEDVLRKINEEVVVSKSNDVMTKQAIWDEYKEHDYLIDPHTATAKSIYLEKENYTLILATASPFKFGKTIKEALSLKSYDIENISEETKTELPEKLLELKNKAIVSDKKLRIFDVRDYILKKKVGV